MTQEEKARAYDETLKRARKQKYEYQKELDKIDKCSECAGILRAGITAIDLALPELKDVEDEKIRKCLYNLVSWFDSDSRFFRCTDVTKTSVLAYLERQKSNN